MLPMFKCLVHIVSGAHIVLVSNSKTDQFSRLVDLMGVQTGLVNPDVPPHNFTEVVTSDNQGTTWSKPSVVNPDGLVGTAVNPEHYDASQDSSLIIPTLRSFAVAMP